METEQVGVGADIRAGDVFKFAYSQESWDRARQGFGHGDLRWAFDGQLVYRDGRFCDTYWGFDWRSDGRSFTVDEARAKGTLTYLCNLNEVEKIRPEEFDLYAEGDAFDLSHQHGCYKFFVRRKGAKKDKDRMMGALQQRIDEARQKVTNAVRDLEWAVAQRERLTPQIEAGEEPYISR